MPGAKELPDTIRRSSPKARRTWVKAHDAAVNEYGEGERAHRTAYAALKRGFEKVGDRWEAKPHRGDSERTSTRDRSGRRRERRTNEGVDVNASKEHLYQLARRAGIRGRSRMSKAQLVRELKRSNARATARARGG